MLNPTPQDRMVDPQGAAVFSVGHGHAPGRAEAAARATVEKLGYGAFAEMLFWQMFSTPSAQADAIVARLYDERSGLFRLLARPAPGREPSVTVSALAPLALPDLPEPIGRRLVEEHLLDPGRFWLPVAPPSVPVSNPAFTLDDRGPLGVHRYWRGPTWVNTAWLIWLGLIRLGYAEPAAAMARGIAEAVLASGLREYYHPFTGAGMGAADFGWSSLVMDMVSDEGLRAARAIAGWA